MPVTIVAAVSSSRSSIAIKFCTFVVSESFWSHATTSNCQLCTSAVVRSVSPSEPGMLLLLYVVSCQLLVHLTAPVVHHHQPGFHVNDWSGKPYP